MNTYLLGTKCYFL